MDMEGSKFGEGLRELGGAVDLINQFKLWPYYEFFCKRLLPLSISETHYLHNVVGDTEIRRGEGMELDQLFQNDSLRGKNQHSNLFDLDLRMEAFQMRETTPVDLLSCLAGSNNGDPHSKIESKDKGRKQKSHMRKDKEKYEGSKKRKHHCWDGGINKRKNKIKHHDLGAEHLQKQQERFIF